MKITDVRYEKQQVEFCDVNPGECFEYCGQVFMRIYRPGVNVIQSVRLRDGYLDSCHPDNKHDVVTLLNAEVLIS